jgi:hypothetical protein
MERLSFHTLSGQIFPLTPSFSLILRERGGECRSKKWIYISSLKIVLRNSDIIEVDNLRQIRHVIKRSEGKRKETPG